MPTAHPHSTLPTPAFSRPVHCMLGLPFDAITLQEAISRVRHAVQTRSPLFISTPNLNFLIASQTDAAFRQSVINSDLSLADGMPIIWIAKLLGIPIKERVAGSTLFESLRNAPFGPNGRPLNIFFFGGPDGVAQEAASKLNADEDRTPGGAGMRCVGFESPGFGSIADMSAPDVIARINAANADFLVVALGASKGQAWIERNRAHLNVPVISHLGAVVNFVAGTVTRAPLWAQRYGLEWAWRIKEEPTLWRRYWSDGLGMLNLMLFQVLPQIWYLRTFAPTQAALQAAAVSVAEEEQGAAVVVQVAGAWTAANHFRLIAALRAHAASEKPLTIDCTHTTHADSSVAGLLSQLHSYRTRVGLPLHYLEPVFLPARRMLGGAVPLD